MKEVKLTRGMVALVDDDDHEAMSAYSWNARETGGNWYAQAYQNRTTVLMHRILLNPPKGTQVDHIDGDGLNNQRANLRIVTVSQNQMNRSKQRNNKSGYKGVISTRSSTWVAQIGFNGRSIYLGSFKTKEEAAAVYREAAQRLHGEFSNLSRL